MYLSRRDQGDVLLLRDANGDGRADGAHSLAIRDNKLYLITVKEVFAASIKPDGRLGELNMLIATCPTAASAT